MNTDPQERIEPVLQADSSMENPNLFAPPKAKMEVKTRKGKLLPHQKAGRVIRLMALLGVFAVIGIGIAVLLPAFSNGTYPSFVSLIPAVISLALVIGLFFVGSAVMRHEEWARIVGIIYGALSLLGFPIGTLVGGYVLWQLVFRWSEVDAES